MSNNLKKLSLLAISASALSLVLIAACLPARAESQGDCHHCDVDYTKLSLSPEQNVKIQQYDQEWFMEYQKLQPEIQSLQNKFNELLASPSAEPTEIMRVQQQIDQKRSSLKSKATQTLLKKRALLSDNQNKQLDSMIREEILKRKQIGQGKNVVPVRWQKLLNNITNIFPQNQPESE